jgi:hypothetical protein
MKFAWGNTVPDLAAWNSAQVEEVGSDSYGDHLLEDEMNSELDKEEDEMIVDY